MIDYDSWFRPRGDEPADAIAAAFGEHFAPLWIDAYHAMCIGPTNVLEIRERGVTYLFDFCAQLPDVDREDRVVGACGLSQSANARRDASRIRGWPGSDERGDRGHLVAHAAGGGLDINLFHQDAWLNRGRSPAGKRYREMERYCAEHDGTFFFSRLIYIDATARPAQIEFAIRKADGGLWVEMFDN